MTIMQGDSNIAWSLLTALILILSVIGVWYFTIVGRDRPPQRQRRGEETLERFGDIEEDRAPLPKFLTVTIIGTIVWGIGYLLWTGIAGLGY